MTNKLALLEKKHSIVTVSIWLRQMSTLHLHEVVTESKLPWRIIHKDVAMNGKCQQNQHEHTRCKHTYHQTRHIYIITSTVKHKWHVPHALLYMLSISVSHLKIENNNNECIPDTDGQITDNSIISLVLLISCIQCRLIQRARRAWAQGPQASGGTQTADALIFSSREISVTNCVLAK